MPPLLKSVHPQLWLRGHPTSCPIADGSRLRVGQEQVIKQLQATLTELFSHQAAGDLRSNRSSVAGELTSLFAIAGQLLQARLPPLGSRSSRVHTHAIIIGLGRVFVRGCTFVVSRTAGRRVH
jgi:hypothetical protein